MSRPATVTISPRDRILDAAGRLFYEEGLHVGISRIIASAEVTPNTLYRHFPGKDILVAAALDQWSAGWLDWLRQSIDGPGRQPEMRVAALWDTLGQWFAADGFRGSFIANAAAALGGSPDHPAQAVIARHRLALRQLLEDVATSAGAEDAPGPGLADELQLLVDGAIAMATVDRRPAMVAGFRVPAATAAGITSGAVMRQPGRRGSWCRRA
jgi:AcrR family transcriptional regulator